MRVTRESAQGTAGPVIAGTPESLTTGDVEIVVSVYNEERSLPGCISALHGYLSAHFPVPWRITVVNNASTDSAADVAASLARTYTGVAGCSTSTARGVVWR